MMSEDHSTHPGLGEEVQLIPLLVAVVKHIKAFQAFLSVPIMCIDCRFWYDEDKKMLPEVIKHI